MDRRLECRGVPRCLLRDAWWLDDEAPGPPAGAADWGFSPGPVSRNLRETATAAAEASR